MNRKRTAREIISRKVNAVVKSVQTLHTTLRNNSEELKNQDWEKMKEHIRSNLEKEFALMDPLFTEDNDFKL